jgi:hypothetical protein
MSPHSSGRGVGRLSRMDFEISGRSRANALGGLIISQSKKNCSNCCCYLAEVLEKLLIFLILMLLIILTGTTETDLEDGQERLTNCCT